MSEPTYWSSDDVNFLDLDLNLLISLDALLSERSVTRAAERLMRSQPSLSAALKRLRHQFDDDLLIRTGNKFELSPLAQQLAGQLPLVMSEIERTFSMRSRFDPDKSKRHFKLFSTDYGVNVIGPILVDTLQTAAPNVTLEFTPIGLQLNESVDQLRAYDGMLLPLGYLGDETPHMTLYTDRWVILAAKNNPIVDARLPPESLAKLDWVIPFHDVGDARLPPVRQLNLRCIDIHTSVIAWNFGAIPALVRGSDRVAFIQERLAYCLGAIDDFSIIECPFDVVPLNEAMYWHPSLSADPGHVWFRSIIEGVGAELRKHGPSEPM